MLIHHIRQFRALARTQRVLFIQAWLALLVVDMGVRWFSLPRLQSLLAGLTRFPRRSSLHPTPSPKETAIIVDLAARHHLHVMTCLRRALALQWLLRRHGVETALRIGVRKDDRDLEAHAWVEHDGVNLGPDVGTAGRFEVIL